MTDLFNFLKRTLSVFTFVLVFLSSAVNSVFEGHVREYKSVDYVAGLESLTRSQDITTDGEYFYFSGKTSLEKTDLSCEKIVEINTNAIPDELKEQYGSAHIGGISYYDGIIYAAVEDSKVWQCPLIVLYDAETLEYTGVHFVLPLDKQKRGVPWVAVDGENSVIYTGDSRNYNEVFKFSLSDFSYIEAITLSCEVQKIQGAEVHGTKLYVGTNDMRRAVYTIDLTSGKAEKLFDRISYEYKYIDNFGGEGEGLTLLEMPDGTFIHTLQIGALFIDSSLRHYENVTAE